MVDTAKRNAPRLAPLLCSERISPLLCRCFFLLFAGRREGGADVDVGFWVAPQASEIKAFRRGPPRTCTWFSPTASTHSLRYSMPTTTIAHNAPMVPRVVVVKVISHFTFEAKKRSNLEGEASAIWNHAYQAEIEA